MARNRKKFSLDELMDISTVAAQLGHPVENIRMRAQNNGVGTQVGKLGRVYTPVDVEALRALIKAQTGPKVKTLKLKAQVEAMKSDGISHVEIARRMNLHPSYIPKLLKVEG